MRKKYYLKYKFIQLSSANMFSNANLEEKEFLMHVLNEWVKAGSEVFTR